MKTSSIFNYPAHCAQCFFALTLLCASSAELLIAQTPCLIRSELGSGRLVSLAVPANQTPAKVTVRLRQAVYWTTEGNDTVWLSVERGNDVAHEPFTVQYATSDLTAKAGLDYETEAGVLSFAPGERNKTVAIRILNDQVQENEESLACPDAIITLWPGKGPCWR